MCIGSSHHGTRPDLATHSWHRQFGRGLGSIESECSTRTGDGLVVRIEQRARSRPVTPDCRLLLRLCSDEGSEGCQAGEAEQSERHNARQGEASGVALDLEREEAATRKASSCREDERRVPDTQTRSYRELNENRDLVNRKGQTLRASPQSAAQVCCGRGKPGLRQWANGGAETEK